ncbi:PREDICTED: zinc finger protein 583-like [Nicrophorus vespilloides]|uniref:Zinc finger protein 583-like n=1 Tax=Nicrophorus vespilloides TaxID=110193 RepID=A0ABM1M882_NICVS|nr:PREDICTED: zinc finger protein 583-like [Nicrophorus vespilloides]
MELDFNKVCRVCVKEGQMMSIFKANVFKKLMTCASVQVWQNDGLPAQICKKCLAKLHISIQFKKQCEKSDGHLRQYQKKVVENSEAQVVQQIAQPTQQDIVFIDCGEMLEITHNQTGFEPMQNPVSGVSYNLQPQNVHTISDYPLESVQVFNSSYPMPLQPMQNTSVIHNQIIVPQQIDEIPQNVQVCQTGIELQNLDNKEERKLPSKETSPKGDNSKQCKICYKFYATRAKLTRHLKTHSSEMPYKCNVCNKAFAYSGNYKIHLRIHTDERPFTCTVCNKGCRQAQDLEKHMRTHTGEKPHPCNLCSRAFSTSSNLIAHIRTHTGERPYVCCVCQKSFCQSNELTKHMRTHTGEKSHICNICHKGFNGSSTLKAHRRTHTGERPYVCRICNHAFTQSSCLMAHMKRHSRDEVPLRPL